MQKKFELKKLTPTGRSMISFPHYLKTPYDQYLDIVQKSMKFGTYNYYDLFRNILEFLKKKGFDPTKQY